MTDLQVSIKGINWWSKNDSGPEVSRAKQPTMRSWCQDTRLQVSSHLPTFCKFYVAEQDVLPWRPYMNVVPVSVRPILNWVKN